ncbi:short chain dehydrogenase [Xylaria palmicola]|nr:short chain dehydrogenase [Xylaria palmicola]
MAEVIITDESLSGLKDKVAIVTGGSSGIGLATVQLLLSVGASVVSTDLQEAAEGAVSSPQFAFHRADVTAWRDLVGVFKKAVELHGRVDHVFANAGIGPKTDYVDGIELDESGDPKEPTHVSLDVNLKGVIDTATLGIHYIRRNAGGGSVVVNSSTTGLQRFRGVDYTVAKHGVIGLMRGLHSALAVHKVPVRVNAVAPSWTMTGLVQEETCEKAGVRAQPPGAVARAVVMLMADESRRGHLIHVDHGEYKEADEALLLPAYTTLRHKNTADEDKSMGLMVDAFLTYSMADQ